jgi:hypothetical protein
MIRLVLLAAAIALALTRAADARRLPWCGFYMMELKHKTDLRLARAREWGAKASRRVDLSPASSSGHTTSARSGTALTSAADGSCIPAMTAMRSERAGVRCSA